MRRIYKPSILVVDDHDFNYYLLEKILNLYDVQMVYAKDGSEALKLAEEISFILAFIDVVMPGMNGFETTVELRKIEKFKETPVIFISANEESDMYEVESYQFGAVDFIHKPFQPRIITNKVKMLLDGYFKEEELKVNLQETKRNNQDLQNFAGMAAHDLKSPLAVVQNYLELLGQSESLDKMTQGNVSLLINSTVRMQELIENLLKYTETASAKPNLEKNSLKDIIKEVIQDLEVNIKKVNAKIEYTNDLSNIYCDKVLMRQLLQNLINNALKFKKDQVDPVIKVSTRIKTEQRLTIPIQNKEICIIEIQDNGIGIKKENQDKIFNTFTRLSSEFEGHGLGLATCKRIIDLHQGSISVVSPGEGEGTSFFVTLAHEN